jgi:hypothetical protein
MLKSKIPDGKKAVANKGYRGDPKKLATQNTFDSAELKTFKKRIKAHHETMASILPGSHTS